MIVKQVQDLLIQGGIVDGRIYPDELPPAPTFPAVLVSLIAKPRNYDMQGDVGIVDPRVQIDVYCVGYTALVDICSDIDAIVSGYKSTAESGGCAIQGMFVINEMDMDVSETEKAGPKLRRRMLEIRVWSSKNG